MKRSRRDVLAVNRQDNPSLAHWMFENRMAAGLAREHKAALLKDPMEVAVLQACLERSVSSAIRGGVWLLATRLRFF